MPQPYGPLPDSNQLRWQQMEYYAFIHLSVNTYTDMSWGFGNEDPKIFNPKELDCRQWARICKQAGMKGIIITAKHHSGFCLWPSKFTDYSIKNSPWKNGKGDIVREMSNACKEYGLKLGIYLSPWDRNRSDYGSASYITYFRNQLTELLTNYGDIFEIWFDGANGGSGFYGGANETRKIDRTIYYDWPNTYKLVRQLQPNIVIWNDGGDRADLRWVGTEGGYVGETNWSLLDSTGEVAEDMLRYGLENGNKWVPGEVNTSIRPEWFYHKKEDAKVKTLNELMDIYYHSIGRNATLLLNFPIQPNGLIHPFDEKAVLQFAGTIRKAFAKNLLTRANVQAGNVRHNDRNYDATKAIDQSTETYWTTEDNLKTASLTISFPNPVSFNRFLVQEYIKLGQRVKAFSVDALIDNDWKEIAKETTIGYKRILRFPVVKASKIRLNITDAKANPLISNIAIFDAPVILAPPVIRRNKSGDISITSGDAEAEIFYTTNGTIPSVTSKIYSTPVPTTNDKIQVKAISYDPRSKKISAVTNEQFDIVRKSWKVVGIDDEKTNQILDGDPNTQWYQSKEKLMPIDLIIDLGKSENITGFKYLPDQNWWSSGIVTNYEFSVSPDGKEWKKINDGEFSNIKNNPVLQIKTFQSVNGRYVKLTALKNTQGDNKVGYAEFDIITR